MRLFCKYECEMQSKKIDTRFALEKSIRGGERKIDKKKRKGNKAKGSAKKEEKNNDRKGMKEIKQKVIFRETKLFKCMK